MRARAVKVYKRGVDDIVTAIVNGKVASIGTAAGPERRLSEIGVFADGVEAPHIRAKLARPPKSGARAKRLVVDADGDEIEVFHDQDWRLVSCGDDVDLICAIRRPRYFGRAKAAFILHGAHPADAPAAAALNAIGAAMTGVNFRLATAFIVLTALIATVILLASAQALFSDGIIPSIGGVQFILIGAALAFAARYLLAPFLMRGAALYTVGALIVAIGLAAAASPGIVSLYDRFEVFFDPASYFVETVGGPIEASLLELRASIAAWEEGFGRGAMRDALLGALTFTGDRPAPTLDAEAVGVHRALIFSGAFAAVLSVIAGLAVAAVRMRTIHDMSMLVWAGGGPLQLRRTSGAALAAAITKVTGADERVIPGRLRVRPLSGDTVEADRTADPAFGRQAA